MRIGDPVTSVTVYSEELDGRFYVDANLKNAAPPPDADGSGSPTKAIGRQAG